MQCKLCKKDMKFIACSDNPNEGFAYNIYHCDECMVLCKENVWDNAGKFWVLKDNTIESEV